MATSIHNKTHLTEIAAGLSVVLGLGAGVFVWWLGARFAESAGLAAGFLFTAGMFALVGEGLRNGKMGGKNGKIYRDKSPVKFWGFAVFYIFSGCAIVMALLFMVLLSF